MEFRLREILNERGITIKAFAKKMGVVPNSLPLSVTYAPSLTSLQKYATALNIPCVELVRKPDVPTPVTDADCTDGFDLNEMALGNIKRLMTDGHLTLKAVAEGAGISVQGLSQTLKNNKMSITTLEKIANGLGVEPWTLLVDGTANKEADAAAPSGFDHNDPQPTRSGLLQPVRPMVEAEPEEPVFGPEVDDLFAQIQEPQEVVMQEGVTYVCGNTRITIVNGVMEIRVQDKKAI